MAKRIAILGSFDTKGAELGFLRDRIHGLECLTLCIDASLGADPTIPTDISSAEVATAAGADIREIRKSRDTRAVTETMIRGASAVVRRLFDAGRLDGIISIGGASNTGLATTVMGVLPFGVPKVMVSSMAAVPAYAGSYFGTKDITMIHSVVDIAGLNPLLASVLSRAAGAVCGMVGASSGDLDLFSADRSRPRVALTEFKFSETCCRHAAGLLAAAGVEVVPFHAQGIGDRAMEGLIQQGLIDGVLDVVPAGLAEEVLGGNRGAGPDRLEAAGRAGIPQVVTPCGFDMLSCGPVERGDREDPLWVTRQLLKRKRFVPDAQRVQVRTTAEELVQIADLVAAKLNRGRGATCVLIPTRGWSSLSEEGMPLCDFDADAAFTRCLKDRLDGGVDLRELDLALNTVEFAEIAVAELLRMLGARDHTTPDAASPAVSACPPESLPNRFAGRDDRSLL
ncbi:MAG: Tm-1-like ATP-binding domain-containing protein [Deltaproteobacteria bacterium]|nr:Tm-1-like ATP-binding domain-containing protein [Deltaproteobacteria bacterium]